MVEIEEIQSDNNNSTMTEIKYSAERKHNSEKNSRESSKAKCIAEETTETMSYAANNSSLSQSTREDRIDMTDDSDELKQDSNEIEEGDLSAKELGNKVC